MSTPSWAPPGHRFSPRRDSARGIATCAGEALRPTEAMRAERRSFA
ncbi:MAG: hypothetical protein ABI193_13035 [Minicystis sp.]